MTRSALAAYAKTAAPRAGRTQVERGFAAQVHQVDVRASVEQLLHDGDVAVGRRTVQRSVALQVRVVHAGGLRPPSGTGAAGAEVSERARERANAPTPAHRSEARTRSCKRRATTSPWLYWAARASALAPCRVGRLGSALGRRKRQTLAKGASDPRQAAGALAGFLPAVPVQQQHASQLRLALDRRDMEGRVPLLAQDVHVGDRCRRTAQSPPPLCGRRPARSAGGALASYPRCARGRTAAVPNARPAAPSRAATRACSRPARRRHRRARGRPRRPIRRASPAPAGTTAGACRRRGGTARSARRPGAGAGQGPTAAASGAGCPALPAPSPGRRSPPPRTRAPPGSRAHSPARRKQTEHGRRSVVRNAADNEVDVRGPHVPRPPRGCRRAAPPALGPAWIPTATARRRCRSAPPAARATQACPTSATRVATQAWPRRHESAARFAARLLQ